MLFKRRKPRQVFINHKIVDKILPSNYEEESDLVSALKKYLEKKYKCKVLDFNWEFSACDIYVYNIIWR